MSEPMPGVEQTRSGRIHSSRTHSSRIGAWFDHHLYSFVASLGRFFRRPWANEKRQRILGFAWVGLDASVDAIDAAQCGDQERLAHGLITMRSGGLPLMSELQKADHCWHNFFVFEQDHRT